MAFCVRGSNRDEIFLAGIVTRCLCRGLLSRGAHDESKYSPAPEVGFAEANGSRILCRRSRHQPMASRSSTLVELADLEEFPFDSAEGSHDLVAIHIKSLLSKNRPRIPQMRRRESAARRYTDCRGARACDWVWACCWPSAVPWPPC